MGKNEYAAALREIARGVDNEEGMPAASNDSGSANAVAVAAARLGNKELCELKTAARTRAVPRMK